MGLCVRKTNIIGFNLVNLLYNVCNVHGCLGACYDNVNVILRVFRERFDFFLLVGGGYVLLAKGCCCKASDM
jgi:hypothetical protein